MGRVKTFGLANLNTLAIFKFHAIITLRRFVALNSYSTCKAYKSAKFFFVYRNRELITQLPYNRFAFRR
jgi:hypothetical protein